MRLFIAALLPDDVKAALGGYIASLRKVTEGVKWEREEKLHVTLKFLGETDEAVAEAVSFVAGAAAGNYAHFEMSTGNLGGFPSLERPRILYAGLSGSDGLSALQNDIDEGLEPHGFGRETRTFVPHVTIGRVNGRMRTTGPLPVPEKVRFTISEISVVRSVPGRTGSAYTPLDTFTLGG